MPKLRLHDMFAAIDGRDWERLPQYFAKDVVYCRPGYLPIRGLAELDCFYRKVRIIATGQHTVERLVLSKHVACCWGRFDGQSRDGRTLSEQFADAYILTDGLISFRKTFFFRAAI